MKPAPRRRSRATPEAIVASARNIAQNEGWPAVTIRAIAKELGYASPILYEHFASKDEVLAAAARLGFERLEASLANAEGSPGTDDRVVALGVAYLMFAEECPELYRVMHGLDGVVKDPGIIAQEAGRVVQLAAADLTLWAESAGVQMPDPYGATELLWWGSGPCCPACGRRSLKRRPWRSNDRAVGHAEVAAALGRAAGHEVRFRRYRPFRAVPRNGRSRCLACRPLRKRAS